MKHLHLVVRRPLEATMSRYLIDRIDALPNVTIHVGSEIAALEGDRQTGLTGVVFCDRKDGSTERCAVRYLFLFVGADPNANTTERLPGLTQIRRIQSKKRIPARALLRAVAIGCRTS